MNRLVICLFAFSICCYAQTAKPKTSPPPKSKALVACETDRAAAMAELDKLKAENAELAKKYDGAVAVLAILNSEFSGKPLTAEEQKRFSKLPSEEAVNLGASVETQMNNLIAFANKVSEHDSLAVEKYNALLADYKDYVTRVGIQLAQIGQANRVSNALSIYQMLPRYTPPQTLNINVSDCTKYPALCVH